LDYRKIHIKNPITNNSIDQLIIDIKSCNPSLLMINIGAQNFESNEVIKEFKNRLELESNTLNSFRKIAFLNPPAYKNKAENTDRYNFFSDRKEAVKWLTSI